MKNQRSEVLRYLTDNGSITSMQAIEMFGATRLSSIIYDLRHKGYNITSEMVSGKTRYGGHCHYAIYTLRS